MIKRGLQTLITKVSLQRLPNFAGRHEDHYFPPVWEPELAQLGDDLWPLRWRRLPSKKGDVRSIHIADKNSRVPHSKGRQNPLLHLHPGGRCECKNRGRAESFPNLPQTTVFGPKVPAPLVDAMGLVDYKERRSDRPEHLEFALVPDKEPFRRRIKKLEARLRQEPIAEPLIVAIEITVDEGGGYLEPEESGDLFSHQRLQGRDNDAHPLSQDGRQLKAQGLTETLGLTTSTDCPLRVASTTGNWPSRKRSNPKRRRTAPKLRLASGIAPCRSSHNASLTAQRSITRRASRPASFG